MSPRYRFPHCLGSGGEGGKNIQAYLYFGLKRSDETEKTRQVITQTTPWSTTVVVASCYRALGKLEGIMGSSKSQ